MNKKVLAFILVIFMFVISCAEQRIERKEKLEIAKSPRERLLMDFGWKFEKGHLNNIEKDFNYGWGDPYSNAKTGDLTGPTRFDFDDSGWRVVDLPHDWELNWALIRMQIILMAIRNSAGLILRIRSAGTGRASKFRNPT